MSKTNLKLAQMTVGQALDILGKTKIEKLIGLNIAPGLLDKLSLLDVNRLTPKAEGGEYTEGNYEVITPVDHAKKHGTFVVRSIELTELKTKLDTRNQCLNTRNKLANQLTAYLRRRTGDEATLQIDNDFVLRLQQQINISEETLKQADRAVEQAVELFAQGTGPLNKLVKAALELRGVGPMTVAHCIVYINLEKCTNISKVWAYTGLHTSSHERYKMHKENNTAGGGNKKLRTAMYLFADAQRKLNGPYAYLCNETKAKLAVSDKLVKSRNTQGKLVEIAWKDAKAGHRDGAGLRKIMKHFLADWVYVGRDLLGLTTPPVWAEAKLGRPHSTVMPDAHGWVWKKSDTSDSPAE